MCKKIYSFCTKECICSIKPFYKPKTKQIMYYKARQQKRNGKWYPQSVLHGRTVTTKQLCDDIAQASTVAPADVLAVLRSLSDAMVKYLVEGRSVKLDGIGNFYLTATAKGNGVEKAEDVSPQQINKVMVRFLAEKMSSVGGIKSNIPTLAAAQINWQRVDAEPSSGSGSGSENGGSNGGTTSSGDDPNSGND